MRPPRRRWLARLEYQMEWRLRSDADILEAGFAQHVGQPCDAGLRTQTVRALLRKRRGRTNEARAAVEDAPDRIEIVLQPIFGRRLDHHKCTVRGKRTANVLERANGIAHVVNAIEARNEVVGPAGKVRCRGDVE